MLQLLIFEGYCYFLDFMIIAYFPETNRGVVFPPKKNQYIDDLSNDAARDMTRLLLAQLSILFNQLRIPTNMCYGRKYSFRLAQSTY